jgi:hypothetical protein
MFRQGGNHLDRLADVQTGWKTLGQAGIRSDRIENIYTGWQMLKRIKQILAGW